jgi:hypothetical protein
VRRALFIGAYLTFLVDAFLLSWALTIWVRQ